MLRGHCMGVTHHKRIARISLLVDDLAVGGTAHTDAPAAADDARHDRQVVVCMFARSGQIG